MKEHQTSTHSTTSIFPNDEIQFPKEDQFAVPTWGVIVFLVLVFFILKAFVYIKDEKRHGK